MNSEKIYQSSSVVPEKGKYPVDSDSEFRLFLSNIIKKYFSKSALGLAYRYQDVLLLAIQNEDINFSEPLILNEILEIRIFSSENEFHLWKNNQDYYWRVRSDDDQSELVNVYEQEHLLWGTKLVNDHILQEGSRGISISLPFSISQDQIPLRYVVRNYFQYDSNGLIQFFDARLVCIKNNKGDEIHG